VARRREAAIRPHPRLDARTRRSGGRGRGGCASAHLRLRTERTGTGDREQTDQDRQRNDEEYKSIDRAHQRIAAAPGETHQLVYVVPRRSA